MNKFTVIVPTRERADTLFHTLRTCVAQDYENFTILVSDNCSTDNTEEVVRSFNDKRIRYIKTPGRLSMSANWDFALDHVTDGYVNYIGDDDGIIYNSLTLINQMLAEYPVDAITSKDMAIYFWPDYVEDEIKGNLMISLRPTFKLMDTQAYFKKSFDACNCVHLPQLYHGYVNVEKLRQLKGNSRTFFNGSSPDIYSGVVLGHALKNHIFSDYPLTIHGLSHHSIGSSNAFSHIKKNPSEKFWSENTISFHEKLEKHSSIILIYADAFLLARNYFKDMPEVDIKNVIKLALDDSDGFENITKRDSLIEVLSGIAAKNNLENYFRDILAKKSPVKKQAVPRSGYGFNPINEMMTVNTTDIGLKNVYDAFEFCKNTLPIKAYSQYDRPLNEPILEYFKRGIMMLSKKIVKS
ncbi:MAG: glycosyltransferase family 2 protein [Bacteroidota bacterium]